ncbi:MAG: protein kinase [Rhodopirellula sp.]|nr:protein kinase [Rhodopirellula sp.]
MDVGYLPAAPCVTAHVDRLCDRFETAWKSGRRPSMRRYLRRVEHNQQAELLLELIQIDVEYRGRRGEKVQKGRYLRRFPEHATAIESLWRRYASSDNNSACREPDRAVDRAEAAPSTICFAPPTLRRTTDGSPDSLDPSEITVAKQRLSSLRQTWPFSEMAATTLGQIALAARERRYSTGDVLIHQGETCGRLLVLVDGTVAVRVEEDGRQHTIATVRTAALFGEMSLLSGNTCTASVVATSPVFVLEIPAVEVERIAARHPVVRAALGGLVADRLGGHSVDALVGKIVGGYRIVRCAGRGGMAVVYEAEDCRTGRRVALKMMSHRYVHDLELHNRFAREAEIGKRLRHPNVCRVQGTFSALGTNFMVLDFCEGITLDERIRRGPLDEDETRRILGQLAAALDYAHRQGVCHRDLKPSNVMLDRLGRVKLMDFGLARSLDTSELTVRGRLLGTPRYMPPEQLVGDPVDCRADLYAFGCVAYEMLTGRPLFPEASYLGIVERHSQWVLPTRHSVREGLSRDLYKVLCECLTKEPQRRILDLNLLGRRWKRGGRRKKTPSPVASVAQSAMS